MEEMMLQGRRLTSNDITMIRELISVHPHWHRTRLSRELCTRWNWYNDRGQMKDMACRTLLLKLEQRGIIALPKRKSPSINAYRNKRIQYVLHDTTPITDPLKILQPLTVEVVTKGHVAELFRCLIAKYHYLGYSGAVGQNMKYIIFDRFDRPLACALFGSAAWKTACRDSYIDWTQTQQRRHLHLVANNMRYLILPWVSVPHLASHILSLLSHRVSSDWMHRYGHRIVLLETFVDTERFRGTCYRAANWVKVGQTTGRSRNDRYSTITVPVKDVFVYPLVSSFRRSLSDYP